MHDWKALSFCTSLFFIQRPMLWSSALHKRGGMRWIKRTRKKWNRERKREKCGSDIYVRRFGRDRPEENLPRFYFRSLGCPSLSPSFVCISSAAIHSRRLSRTTEYPRNSGWNAIIWDVVISWEYKFNQFVSPFEALILSDFIVIMAPYAAILNRILRLVTRFHKSLWLDLQFCMSYGQS